MSYYALKHLHMAFALASGLLFSMRGLWALQGSALSQRRSLRLASHAIDSVLLATALILVWWSAQYPFSLSWLTVKLAALLTYIAAGSIALKRGKRRSTRIAAFGIAILMFVYILKLALTKQIF